MSLGTPTLSPSSTDTADFKMYGSSTKDIPMATSWSHHRWNITENESLNQHDPYPSLERPLLADSPSSEQPCSRTKLPEHLQSCHGMALSHIQQIHGLGTPSRTQLRCSSAKKALFNEICRLTSSFILMVRAVCLHQQHPCTRVHMALCHTRVKLYCHRDFVLA